MSDHDALDDIENRAALLMARREAMRHQQNPAPASDDHVADDHVAEDHVASGPEAVQRIPVDVERQDDEWQDDGRGTPIERFLAADDVTAEVVDPVGEPERSDEFSVPHETPLGPNFDELTQDDEHPQPNEDEAVINPELANGRHRMALPPWQTAPSPIREDIAPGGEEPAAPVQSNDVGEEPPVDPTADRFPLPPMAPVPTGSWPVPPPVPGWAPGMAPPPPPPGWPGMPPPWMAPPLQADRTHPAPQPQRLTRASAPVPAAPPPALQQQIMPTFQSPPSLDEVHVLTPHRRAPSHGWRRWVYRMTGGKIDPGPTPREREEQALVAHIQRPIIGDYKIAVLSIKGGVGKTATTLGLGSALATVRTDRVIAVDANPDRGTLAERVLDISTLSTVRDLLRDPDIHRYADVRNHTRMAATSRLEVLASEQDPAVAEVFGEEDYRQTIEILRQYYNVVLTDCGTGIIHSAMAAVLDLADAIVLVSSPAIDAARSASATLDWLVEHGYGALVRDAHVVFSASRPGADALKLDKVSEHFEARCGSVHVIPFDPHLAEGAEFDFNVLRPTTRQAYLRLAERVSDYFDHRR